MRALEALHAREGSDLKEDVKVARDQSGLYLRQIKLEEDQHIEALYSYLESVKNLAGMGRGTSMKFIQRFLLSWFEPLSKLIQLETKKIKANEKGLDRSV
jgi:hypothetical protein